MSAKVLDKGDERTKKKAIHKKIVDAVLSRRGIHAKHCNRRNLQKIVYAVLSRRGIHAKHCNW